MSNHIIKTACLLAGALLVCLYGCGKEAETGVDKKADPPAEKQVNICPVEASAPEGSMEYVGVMTAHRKVTVSAELGGLIERLSFEKGDRVREGMLLAEVGAVSARLQVKEAEAAVAAARSGLNKMEKGSRPQEIQIATSAVSAAEAALFEAEKNHERIKRLYDIRAVSNSSYDTAERQLTTARANMESAKQQLVMALEGPRIEDINSAKAALAQAEAVLALAEDRLKKSMIRAPCDGVIAFREVEQGEVILPGTPITEIVELGRMKIKLSLSEKDVHLLKDHTQFPFTVDALPREEFSCRVFFLSPTADTSTRAFPLELVVDNPIQAMADGMTVRVRLPAAAGKKVVKIPSAWLSEQDGKIGIYVFEDQKARFKEVTLGAYYENRVEILKGLQSQDLIITNPSGLKEGEAVKVRQ
ncbi:MAG: efflux RND transporter periplasmic adaptor subunit [Deltaproteobacteria bacterium]|nr:efflux RND transporter periplasmic adaptor subunit [Deltaproteobacteria bacterium]